MAFPLPLHPDLCRSFDKQVRSNQDHINLPLTTHSTDAEAVKLGDPVSWADVASTSRFWSHLSSAISCRLPFVSLGKTTRLNQGPLRSSVG